MAEGAERGMSHESFYEASQRRANRGRAEAFMILLVILLVLIAVVAVAGISVGPQLMRLMEVFA